MAESPAEAGQADAAADQTQVLIVDREKLSGLIQKMLTKDYATDVALTGMNAVDKLRQLLPDVIVVEADVPGGGFKLAELVGLSPKYRGIPVILMSGNPTPDMVLRARNAGAASYLAKPFKPSDLHSRIKSAIQTISKEAAEAAKGASAGDAAAAGGAGASPEKGGASVEAAVQAAQDEDEVDNAIGDRVKAIEGLPSFPSTHAEIMELAKSDESSSDDIADKLQLDPSLIATVLKVVNSSQYAANKRMNSLKLAVARLGLEEIANIVMTAQVFEKLGNYEDGGGLDLKAFWKHSVGTAFVARAISKKLQAETESSFLAGMLHDLGKVVLDRFFSDYYTKAIELVHTEEMSISKAEFEILGLTHAEIGGLLAKEWNFSNNYANTITHHHKPGASRRYQRLVCLVHIADAICRDLGFGSGGDDLVPDIDSVALDRFSIGDKGVSMLKEAAEGELEEADAFLSALAS